MFGFLTLCLKLAIYAGALTTVIADAVFGPEITTELGFPGTSPPIAYAVGGVIGIFLRRDPLRHPDRVAQHQRQSRTDRGVAENDAAGAQGIGTSRICHADLCRACAGCV